MELTRLLNEPALVAAAVRAIIFCAVAFGWKLTTEQIGAVMLALEAVLTMLTRALVTPNQLAEARVDAGGRPSVSLDKQLPAPVFPPPMPPQTPKEG